MNRLARSVGRISTRRGSRDPSMPREITLRIVDGRSMAGYNLRYKGKSGTTDVLAFETGDVLVSMDAARRQAKGEGHSTERELYHLAVHGLLHLAGLRDGTLRQRRAMDEVTSRLLDKALGATGTRRHLKSGDCGNYNVLRSWNGLLTPKNDSSDENRLF